MTPRSQSLTWRQPLSIDEASAFLREFPGAVPMGGGQHLVPAWQNTGTPPAVVSLTQIPGLRTIEGDGHALKIGSAVTLQELAQSAAIQNAIPALTSMVAQMGDPFMRNRATLGGALCATRQDGCIPAAMLGMDATVHTTKRDITAHAWFQRGDGVTTLQAGEFITAVSVNVPDVAIHQCLRPVPGRYALVTVFASSYGGKYRVGISGLSDTAFRAFGAESWLARGGQSGCDELTALFSAHPGRTDIHAPGAYREAQTRRLLKKIAET